MLLFLIVFVTLNALCALSFPSLSSDNALDLSSLRLVSRGVIDKRVQSSASRPSNQNGLGSQKNGAKGKGSSRKDQGAPKKDTNSKGPSTKDSGAPKKGAESKGPSRDTTSQTSISPDTVFTTKEGKVTVKSRLIDFAGCNKRKTNAINRAFADALRLADAVGNPDLMWNGNVEPLAIYEYYGRKNDREEVQKRISNNWKRAQLPSTQWKFGDWWFKRYIDIHCDDPLAKVKPREGCKPGVRAYETEPKDAANGNPGDHPSITLCPLFFEDPSLDTRIKEITDGVWKPNDVRNLACQGSYFLHEMFHMALQYPGSQNPTIDPGISYPRCTDKEVRRLPGRAYGPARAKYLARRQDVGAQSASTNNDNYVFFAISLFMKKTWNNKYPIYPHYEWNSTDKTPNVGIAANADPKAVPDGPLYSDKDFYGDLKKPPQSPAGSPPKKVTCSILPPGPRVKGPNGSSALQPVMCGCSDGSKHAVKDLVGTC